MVNFKMHTENEIHEIIKKTAEKNEKIRAVILNGSRACKSGKKDIFQDFDIIYLTNDLQFFIDNQNWIDCFGERIILEMPWYKDFKPEDYNGQFNYQMLLKSGYRIDLTFASLDKIEFIIKNDPVGMVILDKDNIIDKKLFANEDIYLVKPPTKKIFENTCNSFWWVLQNIAKGIKRKELPYTMQMFNYSRKELHKVISWYIGLMNEFNVSTGKMGKYFEKYLNDTHWDMYKKTYPSATYDSIWQSLFMACYLFRELSVEIAKIFSYKYPYDDDQAMTDYLRRIQDLPENAS